MIYLVLRQIETEVVRVDHKIVDPLEDIPLPVVRKKDEPLALVKVNAKRTDGEGKLITMGIGLPRSSRFGMMAPVTRVIRGHNEHVYNLMIGDNEDVLLALVNPTGWRLQEVEQAEWESFEAFELFPVLKLAMAR